MVSKLVYQEDSYLRKHISRVSRITDDGVVLEETIFHPRSGGVDHDTGYIVKDGEKYRVIKVYMDKNTHDVIHVIEGDHDLSVGDEVEEIIDWERRYRLMRLHTAAHIISAIMYRDYGALITGGNISFDYAYDDFSLEKFDKNIFYEAVAKANEIIKKDLPVKIYWLPRNEALKIPGIVKLAERMPPEIKELRIVEIPGVDIQADGGPHVRRTGEIGEIAIIKIANKGRKKKRLYYTVKP